MKISWCNSYNHTGGSCPTYGDAGQCEEVTRRVKARAFDLLEALREIIAHATIIQDPAMVDGTDTYSVPLRDIDDGRRAIARAEGR